MTDLERAVEILLRIYRGEVSASMSGIEMYFEVLDEATPLALAKHRESNGN